MGYMEKMEKNIKNNNDHAVPNLNNKVKHGIIPIKIEKLDVFF